MAATIFDFVAAQIQERTELEKLEARGTLRLALKQSGLDPQSVSAAQMRVVLDKVLPGELESRGVDDAVAVCGAVTAALKADDAELIESTETSPEEVFRRLAGR